MRILPSGRLLLARQAGEDKVLTLDIGGTSADFALIIGGEAQFGTGELIGEFPLHIPTVSVSYAPTENLSFGAGFVMGVALVEFVNYSETLSPARADSAKSDNFSGDIRARYTSPSPPSGPNGYSSSGSPW